MRIAHRAALRRDDRGFSLVEVLVATTLLIIGVLGLLAMLDTANATTARVRALEGATTLARQVSEAARSIPYRALTPQTIEHALQAQPGLAGQGSSADWLIQRRRFLYRVTVTVCSVDDPADGMGPHDTGLHCANIGAPGVADRNPDDYKRVGVEVSWGTGAALRRVKQVVVINNPGSAGGPAVTAVTQASPAGSPVTTAVPALVLAGTTSSPAATMTWSVDGVVQATAAGNATDWNFSWPVTQLVDGTYLVTAQAFDQAGLSGPIRSLTVTLNRFLASPPAGFAGGRNGAIVDFEWLENPERDIVGYRVFRISLGGGNVEVCALTRTTTCQDKNPPSGPLAYYLVADDLDAAGQPRDGAPSSAIAVTTSNRPPNPPPELGAEEVDGVTELTWTASSPADPDGDSVAFYRIYRDGTAFADRYDRTGTGAELSYRDGDTDGTPHEYHVVAVDGQLAESAPVGPVTL